MIETKTDAGPDEFDPPPTVDAEPEPHTEAAANPSHRGRNGARQTCSVSGRAYPAASLVRLSDLWPTLVERIQRDFPDLSSTALISKTEVDRYRALYVEELLFAEHGELTALDMDVAQSLAKHDTIAENVQANFDDKRTLGESLSDGVASFGGSWTFIIGFMVILLIWAGINLVLGGTKAFDPYPFIFLNLILSCIAAIQAPIIMMSQKRTEHKDRLRSENDYRVNLKAELEIRHLHEKIDHLISKQWQRLAEIQQLQLDSMQQDHKARE